MAVETEKIKKDSVEKFPNRWRKGVSGNPLGKPKGIKHERTLLQEAIKIVESDPRTICNCQIIAGVLDRSIPRCQTIREHFIRRGLVNDAVVSGVLKKLEPDLVHDTTDRKPTTINILYGHAQEIKPPQKVQVFEGTSADT